MDLHRPVFWREIKEICEHSSPGIIIDLTFGRGGYSQMALDANLKNIIVAFDRDPEAVQYAKEHFSKYNDRFHIAHCRYSEFDSQFDFDDQPVLIMADLGISSPQIDTPSRGMSYRFKDELVDLRMDTSRGKPAWKILPTTEKQELAAALKDFGELRMSGKLAQKIIEASIREPLTTGTLEKISNSIGGFNKITANVFQAIRIWINEELKDLNDVLLKINTKNWKGAKIVIVTFHSLEDRIVKHRAREYGWKQIEFIKEVSEFELEENPRARSAKLRFYEF